MKKSEELVEVAKIGKVVGLKGYFKLHNLSDFLEQFKKNATFLTDKDETLTIEDFNKDRSIVKFLGISDATTAQKYVNSVLKTTISKTKESIKLKKDEFFWFDVIGCDIVEDEVVLGKITEIERIGAVDYLHVKSDEAFDKEKFESFFLVPYIDRYVVKVDIEAKKVFTKDAKYFLEK